MTHDMIQCDMTWQQIQLCSHMIHVCTGLTLCQVKDSPENLSHLKFKCNTNRKQV